MCSCSRTRTLNKREASGARHSSTIPDKPLPRLTQTVASLFQSLFYYFKVSPQMSSFPNKSSIPWCSESQVEKPTGGTVGTARPVRSLGTLRVLYMEITCPVTNVIAWQRIYGQSGYELSRGLDLGVFQYNYKENEGIIHDT